MFTATSSPAWANCRLVSRGSGWYRLEAVPVNLAAKTIGRLEQLGCKNAKLMRPDQIQFAAPKGIADYLATRFQPATQ
jgi:hypothetical protein